MQVTYFIFVCAVAIELSKIFEHSLSYHAFLNNNISLLTLIVLLNISLAVNKDLEIRSTASLTFESINEKISFVTSSEKNVIDVVFKFII